MKYLILLFLLFSTSLYAADNIWYREAFVETTITDDGRLDLPFPVYAQTVYKKDGANITGSLYQPQEVSEEVEVTDENGNVTSQTVTKTVNALSGVEVVASVDVMIDHQTLHRNDWPLVEAFIGKITESEFYAQITQTKEEASVEENF